MIGDPDFVFLVSLLQGPPPPFLLLLLVFAYSGHYATLADEEIVMIHVAA